MLLLAYYIAAVNIETTYADVAELAPCWTRPTTRRRRPTYEPFPGLVLTDTFQSYEDGDRDDLDIFPENNERIARQRALPITVIVGNPPYSVGQDSANDDNANQAYPTIDAAIRETYAARSTATNKNSLYDSYIRAIKWASLRIKDRGVIAFVTNGGWLDANTADGMRLASPRSSPPSTSSTCAATSAPRRAEPAGGRQGLRRWLSRHRRRSPCWSRSPTHARPGRRSTTPTSATTSPARRSSPRSPTPVALARPRRVGSSRRTRTATGSTSARTTSTRSCRSATRRRRAIFAIYSGGLKTNRDAWVYNFSRDGRCGNMQRLSTTSTSSRSATATRHRRPDAISWSRSARAPSCAARRPVALRRAALRVSRSTGRSCKQWLYFDRD